MIGVNKLLRVPNDARVFGFMPNGLLLLIKTPLPLCEGDACRNVLPTRLAELFSGVVVGVGVGATGAGGGLGLLGAHINFFTPFSKSLSHVRTHIQKKINK